MSGKTFLQTELSNIGITYPRILILVLLIVLSVILLKLILPIFLLFNSCSVCVKCILMCFTILISFSRPSVFLLVFSMGNNRKCTAWLSNLTVLCYLCIGTCVFQGKLQYIHLGCRLPARYKRRKT